MADGRGGARVGKPGASYSNRTDLNAQPVRTQTGQTYGEAGAERAAQQAMPLAGQPTPPDPTGGLYAPTQRADEPVTAGMAQGPGAGPSFGELDDRALIEALARRFPGTPGLDRMLREMR